MKWLAISGADPNVVVVGLRLRHPTPAAALPECDGSSAPTSVFVSRPTQGWVLAIGDAFPAPDDRACLPLLAELSRRLGTVQFFMTQSVIEYHAWARLSNGVLERAYAYCGETGATVWNIGATSAAEESLGFRFFDENDPEAEDDRYWDRDDLSYPDGESVFAIASCWSIDPSDAGVQQELVPGVVCEFLRDEWDSFRVPSI